MTVFYSTKDTPLSVQEISTEWLLSRFRNPVWFQKISLRHWQFVVRFVLVSCLCFSSAHLFWLVFPTPELSRLLTFHFGVEAAGIEVANTEVTGSEIAGTELTSIEVAGVNHPNIDINQLKLLPVFGKVAENSEGKAAHELPATETQLSIVLMGVVASNYESKGHAIINVGNKQDIYAVGAHLPVGDDIVLTKVMNDRVIISNHGELEALLLYQGDSKSTPNVSRATAILSREESQKMLDWQADHAEPEAPAPLYHPTVSLPDQAITALGRSMSNVVSLNTHNDNGKLAGFKLAPGRDADKFKALGLQAGDLVVAVNGWPMSNPEQILEMYNNLGNSASLQIKRGDNIMTVDVALQ